MTKQALLIIDIQNDYFAEGKWPLHQQEEKAQRAAKILKHAREQGDLVVHVRHEAEDPQAPFFVTGTPGADIHPSVAPIEGEHNVLKFQVNSFLGTNLKEILDENGIEKVTIIGSMSHMCIDAATRAASDFGYQVTVIEDACASRDLELNGNVAKAEDVHTAYMSALGFAYAQITSTEAYLA